MSNFHEQNVQRYITAIVGAFNDNQELKKVHKELSRKYNKKYQFAPVGSYYRENAEYIINFFKRFGFVGYIEKDDMILDELKVITLLYNKEDLQKLLIWKKLQ